MSTHQIRRGKRAARSSPSQESVEPLCARVKGANRDVFEGNTDISDHGLFSSCEGRQGGAKMQNILRHFSGMPRAWTAGRWLARRLHQLKASTTMGLGISICIISV